MLPAFFVSDAALAITRPDAPTREEPPQPGPDGAGVCAPFMTKASSV
jgi:hypothetical protein